MVDTGTDTSAGDFLARSSVRLPYGKLLIGCSERKHGDMRSGRKRCEFFASRGLAHARAVTLHQTHGTTIRRVFAHLHGITPNADGMYYVHEVPSALPPVLTLLTADCVPIIVYSEQHPAYGVVHAGWRGVLGGIVQKAVRAMVDAGIEAQSIRVLIGPHIRACCYDVDDERARVFSDTFGSSVVERRQGKQYLSLRSAIQASLTTYGNEVKIFSLGTDCTSCTDGRYFSYRKSTRSTFGEMMHYITLDI